MVKTKQYSKIASKLGNYSDNRSKIKSGTPAKEKLKMKQTIWRI